MNYPLTHPARPSFPIKATVGLLVVASIIPPLVHLIPPYQNTSVGAILLPMFYVPLVALLFYRARVALVIALLSPLADFLLTGFPSWQFVLLISLELVVFTLVAGQLLRSVVVAWVAAPLAFLLTKVISTGLLLVVPLLEMIDPWVLFRYSLSNALPGILLLWVINVAGLSYQQHR